MSEIQPSLGELEDAQNTAYENFFTARDAVTAAGERVAAADEAVCLAEKKYMNGEISVEEWEATLQELSDAQVAECEFPYKSRVMPTSEPLKTLKAPYMARNTMKWGFFRLKSQ